MDAINSDWLLVFTILVCVILLLSKASLHSERLKRIEMLLLSQPGIDVTVLEISPEVKKMIADGHKYRAMALHREQTDSTARSAELAVEQYIARQS